MIIDYHLSLVKQYPIIMTCVNVFRLYFHHFILGYVPHRLIASNLHMILLVVYIYINVIIFGKTFSQIIHSLCL